MILLYIDVQNHSLPVLYLNDKNQIYIGMSELCDYYGIDRNCKTRWFHKYSDFDNTLQFDSNKVFLNESETALFLHQHNITYQNYWFIFSIIKNVIKNKCISSDSGSNDYSQILQTISSNVDTIKRFVTIDPYISS